MIKHIHFTSLLSTLLLASWAHAAPADVPDDLDHMLGTKVLLSQIDQARQTVSDSASDLVNYALQFLGVPYRRGGISANTGFDCSGFVKAIFEQTVGRILPHQAAQQAATTQKIDKSDLQPGDLVFFNTMRYAFSHVGIYLGDGNFIHSPSSGGGVRVESMGLPYWKQRFNGARRVPEAMAEAMADEPETQDSPIPGASLH